MKWLIECHTLTAHDFAVRPKSRARCSTPSTVFTHSALRIGESVLYLHSTISAVKTTANPPTLKPTKLKQQTHASSPRDLSAAIAMHPLHPWRWQRVRCLPLPSPPTPSSSLHAHVLTRREPVVKKDVVHMKRVLTLLLCAH